MSQKSNNFFQQFQQSADRFWQKTVIRILPIWITPNHLSAGRLALVPLILILIFLGYYPLGLTLFALIALTDSLDGALARHRQQITPLGLILDPLADKLLIIGSLLVFLIYYPFPELIIYLAVFELTVIIVGYIWVNLWKRPAIPANLWGKLKMVCQSLATAIIFLWLICWCDWLLYLSAGLLWLALVFIILSALNPLRNKKIAE